MSLQISAVLSNPWVGIPPHSIVIQLHRFGMIFARTILSPEISGAHIPAGRAMALRILLADDHEIVRNGLKALLVSREWTVCGEAADGWEAVTKTQQLKPDIVVMDIAMPNLNGLLATRRILQDNPAQKVVILSVNDSDQVVDEVLAAGARGYVLKTDAARDLVVAIEELKRNKMFFTSKVANRILKVYLHGRSENSKDHDSLTEREQEIVQLTAEGKSSKEAATILNLSVKTVETHRSNVMRKLGVHSLPQLVLYALRHNIVHLPVATDATHSTR